MGSRFDRLLAEGLLNQPPAFLKNNVHLEVAMGSVAYGCSTNTSDVDLYGLAIPPKYIIFPHTSGHVPGFGRVPQAFSQFQQHGVVQASTKKEYDLSIFNIVRYFQLCMENNPNVIDSLFVPRRCVLHSTVIGEHVRESRKMFLHKGSWHKFKGYAFSQMHKMNNKSLLEWVRFCDDIGLDYYAGEEALRRRPKAYCSSLVLDRGLALIRAIDQGGKRSKRLKSIGEFGFDVKFAYHVVRLLNEVEQILTEGDLDLERNREQLKAIRRGEWSLEDVTKYFADKERELEALYTRSELRHSPDEEAIKELLLECLDMHYANLSDCLVRPDKSRRALEEICAIAEQALALNNSKRGSI